METILLSLLSFRVSEALLLWFSFPCKIALCLCAIQTSSSKPILLSFLYPSPTSFLLSITEEFRFHRMGPENKKINIQRKEPLQTAFPIQNALPLCSLPLDTFSIQWENSMWNSKVDVDWEKGKRSLFKNQNLMVLCGEKQNQWLLQFKASVNDLRNIVQQ